MSRKELVFLVSRAFALFLYTWAFAEISYLPERLLSLTHHIGEASVLSRYDYWSSYYLVAVSFLVVRILAFLWAAGSFWRCGPGVQALFAPKLDDEVESA
jgi:hypothetical protein